jgi:O-antigen/teichoic acid export membrane protein
MVMLVLAVGFLARAAVGPAELLLNMLGEQRSCAAILVLAAAADIALGLILVPHYGIVGAAIATASALIGAAILQWHVARRRLSLAIAIWENVTPRR